MIEMRRILFPCDFSPFSQRALGQAVALARAYGADLLALHVIPVTVIPSPALAYYPNPLLLDPGAQDRIREELRRFVEPARQAGVHAEVEVRQGAPSRQIVEMAGTLHADLIVMGTHGRGGFERVVLGSVAEKVLRKAPCPVMTVRENGRAPSPPFERILCPVDFSPASLAAARHAASLAEKSGGLLVLLNVLEAPPYGRLAYPEFAMPPDPVPHEERVRRAFSTAVPKEVLGCVGREERIVWGRPASEILRLAHEERADLIVMGVQGRGAVDLALFGSTTHEVVRHARCPVLTVRLARPEANQESPVKEDAAVLVG
jgi:nucleotide-binding universal stress UspA family protein